MPCRTEEPTPDEMRAAGHPTRADFEAAMCGIFRVLEHDDLLEKALQLTDWEEAGVHRDLIERWWFLHKKRDEERAKRERLQREREEAEERALMFRLMGKYGLKYSGHKPE